MTISWRDKSGDDENMADCPLQSRLSGFSEGVKLIFRVTNGSFELIWPQVCIMSFSCQRLSPWNIAWSTLVRGSLLSSVCAYK